MCSCSPSEHLPFRSMCCNTEMPCVLRATGTVAPTRTARCAPTYRMTRITVVGAARCAPERRFARLVFANVRPRRLRARVFASTLPVTHRTAVAVETYVKPAPLACRGNAAPAPYREHFHRQRLLLDAKLWQLRLRAGGFLLDSATCKFLERGYGRRGGSGGGCQQWADCLKCTPIYPPCRKDRATSVGGVCGLPRRWLVKSLGFGARLLPRRCDTENGDSLD